MGCDAKMLILAAKKEVPDAIIEAFRGEVRAINAQQLPPGL
jgi:hypothetical protein